MRPLTPLLRPRRHFADREVDFFRVMAVVGVLVFTGPLVVYGVGWVMTANVDGTVLVDNPARPPEAFCPESGCEEPEQLERDVDAVIWDAVDELAGLSFLVYPLVLAAVAALLHAGVWLAGGERGWFPTFAVAAWGLLPTAIVAAAFVLGLWATVDPVTVSPGDDPATAFEPLEAQFRALRPVRTAGTVLAAGWGGLVWRAGLLEWQGLRNAEATLIAATVAALDAVVTALL